MLKEMSLGLVLMFGGDGDAARRAGDALLRDKANDAVEEGGFEAVEFGAWDKGFDGRRFWLAFDGVEVRKDGASLAADYAVVFPFSVELRFERGEVVTGVADETVQFAGVDVQGNLSPFRRSIDVMGYGVSMRLAADREGDAICLFERACRYPVVLDETPFDRFAIHMDRAGRRARVEFFWRKAGSCSRLELAELEASRKDSLASIGASLLEGTLDGDVRMFTAACSDESGDEVHGEWNADAAVQRAKWSSRDKGIDDLLEVLLVSVPEAYEYLVE